MDTCSTRICEDGSRILNINTQEGETMTYCINRDRILFTMFKTAILYEKKKGEPWNISDIFCEDVTQPLLGVMTLVGTMRMITFYKIDLAWRWFYKTKNKALDIAKDLEDSPIPLSSSPLLKVDMGSYTSDDDSSDNDDYMFNFHDDVTYTHPRTSPLPIATPTFEIEPL